MSDSEQIEKGKKLLITVIAVYFAVAVLLVVVHSMMFGWERLPRHVVRLAIAGTLCYYLYSGYAWARWLFGILLSIGGVLSVVSGVLKANVVLVPMGAAFLFCGSVLLFSKAVGAFLEQQKAIRLTQA